MSSYKENSHFCRIFEKATCAVEDNDTDVLENAIKAVPKFSTLVDKCGRNLLQLSVHFNRPKIFSYLLSLGCFDLEATDCTGRTVLDLVLLKSFYSESPHFYATSLIKAGAKTDNIHTYRGDYHNYTYLHLAIRNELLENAEVLIQNGADLNARNSLGCTPLHEMIYWGGNNTSEGVSLLLYYGADPTIRDHRGYLPFFLALTRGLDFSTLQHLFDHTFDSHSKFKISAKMFSRLVRIKSPLLYRIMKVVKEIIYDEDSFQPIYFCRMKPYFLEMMIEKFTSFIRCVLLSEKPSNIYINTENLEILLNSKVRFETIEFISKLHLKDILRNSIQSEIPLQEIIIFILYLLTYGLNVDAQDYEYVYKTLGYCDFFKTMLHMENSSRFNFEIPILKIICDIHCDLNTFFTKLPSCSSSDLEHLLDYCALPKLRSFCEKSTEVGLVAKARRVPRVPKLVELGRNATRSHLVKRYRLQKTNQYYSLLKWLQIGTTYEEILSFETKLY